jgi:uncharacterized protein YjdB
MNFKFKLSKRLARLKATLAASVVLALACTSDLTDPKLPHSAPQQLVMSADLTPLPAASVVASANDGNLPQNTLDKSLATRWSAQGDGQWIRYDLGALAAIDHLDIAWYLGDTRIASFDIQVSLDTVTWTTVFSGQSSGQTLQLESYAFPTTSGRYVRIVGHGNSTSAWNSITEVAILGTTLPALPVVSVVASANDGNLPQNTLDKSLATRWSAQGDGQWIQYDLGALANIDHLDIAWYLGDTRVASFDIAVSLDAVSWTTVFSGQSSGQTLQLESYAFPTTSGRYVRIVGHGNSTSAWNSITEVAILGTTLPPALPTPVAAVTVSPASGSIAVGGTQQFSALTTDQAGTPLAGRVVLWSTSSSSVATVSASGLVTGRAAGAATITATSEGKSGSASVTVINVSVATVTVNPASASIRVGASQQLAAVTRDSAGTTLSGRTVAWSTSNASVASVTTSGLVVGLTTGSANITATSEGKSATSTVTVTQVPVATVTVSPPAVSIPVGGTQQLSTVTKDSAGNTLTGRVVTWSSNNTSIATVVSGSGLVSGQAAGSATVTATSEGKSGTATVTVQATPPVSHAGYYVAPNGSASGDGSATGPWNLATGLAGGGGKVRPGDTIWVRGGAYRGGFVSQLNGTATQTIVVRKYPGERATIDGNLEIFGSYTTFWGLEITNSAPASGGRNGIDFKSTGSRLINLVVHDVSRSGVGFWNDATGGELYGCVIYNNGTQWNLDHGVYTNNVTGTKTFADNIIFNNWTHGIQAYDGHLNQLYNLHFDGNIAFGNGTISSPTNTAVDFLVNGSAAHGLQLTNNFTYEVSASRNHAAWISYQSDAGGDAIVTGNYFVTFAPFGPLDAATVSGNTFYSTADVLSTPATASRFTWSGNVHYRDPSAAGWSSAGSAYTFSGWRSASGLGPTDQNPGTRPSGVKVVVRPNNYEAGRANIVVYNWDHLPTLSVDLSAVLQVGDSYEVRNVQSFYGAPVLSGVYAGGPMTLPMTGTTPPTPVGRSFTSPPVTGPEFNVFVVLRVGN